MESRKNGERLCKIETKREKSNREKYCGKLKGVSENEREVQAEKNGTRMLN